MLDRTLASFAFRARAETLAVAATGAMDLSATVAGFARAACSFEDDDFQIGMEVVPSGFASNTTPKLVTRVQPLLLTVEGGAIAQVSGSGRSLSVGLPLIRRWGNTEIEKVARRPYVEADFVPTGGRQWTTTYNGGLRRDEGLWVLRWFGVEGFDEPAIRKGLDGLEALFAPGTTLNAGSEQILIHGEPSPFSGLITPLRNGWAVGTLTVPWRCESHNAVLA